MKRPASLLALLPLLALLAPTALAYTVQPGDTLYSLARREGVTVEELMRLNGLTSSTLSVGQELRLPSEVTPLVRELPGVRIVAPSTLREGDAFVLRLSGERAAEARVRFPSEKSEDVRKPAEDLVPFGAAGEYTVIGRIVLGQTRPLVYEVQLGEERVRGEIPVRARGLRVQNLNLPPEINNRRTDPKRAQEEALVEKAYALRTPQAWTKPFLPLSGVNVVSTYFGQPRRYAVGEDILYHYGTDYILRTGTPVNALNDGTVVVAGSYPVRGGLVVIDHGLGVTSLYFHQSKVSVKVGQKVVRGQKIGEVGSTGVSTGPHLHLEVRVRGEATDPAQWFGKMLP